MNDPRERQLLDDALTVLRERLPPRWTVERITGQGEGEGEGEALFAFASQGGMDRGAVIVEARPKFAAADVDRLLGGLTRRIRQAAGNRPILLVSEFLSPRTRELLAQEDISYVDLTGNVRIVMQSPPIFIQTSGADRRPSRGRDKRAAGLSGAKMGRAVRFLAEVEPPYGVSDIEQATGLSPGWVSRILDRLRDEALIKREPRGPVEDVDWPALLRVRGQSVDLLRSNTARTYIARGGAASTLESIAGSPPADDLVVTGSFAAVRVAPVAAPALLVAYLVPNRRSPLFDAVAEELGLMPAEQGFDVALLWPANEALVEYPRRQDGLSFVNLPQLVVDCLSGTGRMPAEGEALLTWMEENVERWRFPSLAAYRAERAA